MHEFLIGWSYFFGIFQRQWLEIVGFMIANLLFVAVGKLIVTMGKSAVVIK